MSRGAVHLFTPLLEPGAVGSHTRLARDALRAAGYESEIFADDVHAACAAWGARPAREYGRAHRARTDDRLVYQMAIGAPLADRLLGRTQRLIVNHHNLTPLRYFAGWEPVAAHGVVWGRHQLAALAGEAALGVAVSHYNEADLVHAGFRSTTVVPFLLDPVELGRVPDPDDVAALRDRTGSGTTWLFVGRLAPNKAQHDLVKAFAAYRRFHDDRAALYIVGGGVDSRYGRALADFTAALELTDSVHFTGATSAATLAAYYAAADVFVSCSEHEGFCAPVIEAMNRDVPVVAFAAAAIPETAGDAALLLDTKDADTVATAVRRIVEDAALRVHLVAAGRRRVEWFAPDRVGAAFVDAVTSVEPA